MDYRLNGLFAAALVMAACGGGGDGGGDKQPDAGGEMDSGQQGGGNEDSGTPGPVTKMCGTNVCGAPMIDTSSLGPIGAALGPILQSSGFGPTICCAGEDETLCGATQSLLVPDGSCLEQNQEGEPNAACPDQAVSIMGYDLPLQGCCKVTNQCGIDLGLLGVGCVERTEVGRLLAMGPPSDSDAGAPIDLDARPCAFGEEPSTDAGAGDAGAGDAGTGDAGPN